jgi:hypothetical protein
MYIMAPEPILTAISQIPPTSLCAYMSPPIVPRRRLGKNVTAITNTFNQ